MDSEPHTKTEPEMNSAVPVILLVLVAIGLRFLLMRSSSNNGAKGPSFWSDQDRLFVRRSYGIGYSLNLKYLLRKLGLTKDSQTSTPSFSSQEIMRSKPEGNEESLRRRIDESRYEE